ncbi:MAG: hypothetical protein K6E77_13015 [Lachnospiraceae bacterium]|nr:hypothetical protein [Lachnospiraceae bacterium]
MMIIVAIIFGILLALSIVMYWETKVLKDSNALGNSEADYYDFADRSLNVTARQDRIKKPDYM